MPSPFLPTVLPLLSLEAVNQHVSSVVTNRRKKSCSFLWKRDKHSSDISVASPSSQLILQPFRRFIYVATHSPTLPLLLLRHSSFCNTSVALSTSQLILQPFRCFTYITAHSPTLLSLLLRHRLFTYVTWRAAHALSFAEFLKFSR